jgi:ATP-binding cassette, subfamily B, multidrug efflux pump
MLKLFRFLKPHILPIVTVLALMFMGAMADLIPPTLMANIVNTGVVNGDIAYIFRTGAFMLLIAFGGISCAVLSSFFSSGVTLGFSKKVRSSIFARVESYSLYEFDRIGTASLVTRTTNDVNQIQASLSMMMSIMVRAPIMCVGGIIMAVSRDRALSLVLFAAVPVLAVLIISIAGRGVSLFSAMQSKLDRLNMVIREKLSGIRVVRAFDRTEREKERFDGASRGIMDTAMEIAGSMNLMMPAVMLVMNFTIIAVLWFGGLRAAAGNMRVGDIMAFVQYSTQILFSLMMVSMLFIMIPRAQASAVRINEVLELDPGIRDPETVKRGGKRKGSVEFRDVSFKYHGAEQPAICNISFTAGPGEVTAIIGGTGSGKSTLVSLIPRFYDVESGSVIIDGMDVREMALEDLRRRIGFVPQKAVLFSGTAADNIRFGAEGADDADIKRAAGTAQAAAFIESMEEGYESTIEQGGVNLSGGQKQRVSIARAIARKPEIYVFDDSFSALDFKTDAALRAALKKETADASVFIVAQRVATIMDADRIIVLEDGKVAGMGAHKELMQSCGIYREIVYSQISEEELA